MDPEADLTPEAKAWFKQGYEENHCIDPVLSGEEDEDDRSTISSLPDMTRNKVQSSVSFELGKVDLDQRDKEIVEDYQEKRAIHFRIHPSVDFNYKRFESSLEKICPKCLITEEIDGSRRHFHIVLAGLTTMTLRNWWLEFRPESMAGNKTYSIAYARKSLHDLIAYVLKPPKGWKPHHREKFTSTWGFPPDYLQACKNTAYAKPGGKEFLEELRQIETQFVTQGHHIRWYIGEYMKLKQKYDQNYNLTWLKNRAMTLNDRRSYNNRDENPGRWQMKVDEMLTRLNLEL